MQEFNYAASCADLDFTLANSSNGISLSWSGFNDSMMVYISQTLAKLKELKTADLEDVFEIVKIYQLQQWKNYYNKVEYLQVCQTFGQLALDVSFEKCKLRELLEKYDFKQFSDQMKTWMVSGRCEWFIIGNIGSSQSIEVVKNQ